MCPTVRNRRAALGAGVEGCPRPRRATGVPRAQAASDYSARNAQIEQISKVAWASEWGPHEACPSCKVGGDGLSTVCASRARHQGGRPHGTRDDSSRKSKHLSPD
eukprot:5857198-Prymnesium_polylepis.1